MDAKFPEPPERAVAERVLRVGAGEPLPPLVVYAVRHPEHSPENLL